MMNFLELKIGERHFIIPSVPITPILIYVRYRHRYIDFQGWELISDENTALKKSFNLTISEGEILRIEKKILTPEEVHKIQINEVKINAGFPLTDNDYKQMKEKFLILGKLLKQEGLIE